jgi:hypothetical protein
MRDSGGITKMREYRHHVDERIQGQRSIRYPEDKIIQFLGE